MIILIMLEGRQQLNGRFSKILVAIDGSEPSMKAAELAIEIAKKAMTDLRTKETESKPTALTVLDVSKPRGFLPSFIVAPTYGLRELEKERNAAKQCDRKQKQRKSRLNQK